MINFGIKKIHQKGNSWGIIIPKVYLDSCKSTEFEIISEGENLVLKPKNLESILKDKIKMKLDESRKNNNRSGNENNFVFITLSDLEKELFLESDFKKYSWEFDGNVLTISDKENEKPIFKKPEPIWRNK